MNNFKYAVLLLFFSSMLLSCSEDSEKASSKSNRAAEHIWKQQTDALKSAEDVAKQLQQSLNQQKEKLDASN